MLSLKSSFLKLLQLGCVIYMAIALVYTTNYFVLSPVSSIVSRVLAAGFAAPQPQIPSGSFPRPRVDLVTRAWQASHARHLDSDIGIHSGSPWDFATPDDLLYWAGYDYSDTAGSGSEHSAIKLPIRETTFLSRAFAQSMHPTKIIPFYYKASAPVDDTDVTITTLVTSNRYKVLRQLVDRYQGPISVTIHIPLPSHEFELPTATATRRFISAVKELEALYASSPHFATYVDVHLALSPFSVTGSTSANTQSPAAESTTEGARQFNVWRNIARLFARTEFVMMLDVDFAICTDWRMTISNAIRAHQHGDSKIPRLGVRLNSDTSLQDRNSNGSLYVADPEVVERLRSGRIALVVPAFEYIRQQDGVDQSLFPRDKGSLMQLTAGTNPKIATFHAPWAPGHNSTDYTRYFSIPPGSEEIYEVTQYQSAYEPYVIMSKRVTWCDERFIGYGGNKAACLFELYLSGVTFYVMSDHFLIHQSHKYEEEARREERKYNRKLYADFKEEACLRYLYHFKTAGQLDTPIAANAITECRKLKNVVRIASELLGKDIGQLTGDL